MGAWSFLVERLGPELAALGKTLRYVGRPRAAAPAPGSMKTHLAGQQHLVREAFAEDDGTQGRERPGGVSTTTGG
jgi:2-oxoglutarate dehydrogenase complex dehydrogenase (E1) component-like enzyme